MQFEKKLIVILAMAIGSAAKAQMPDAVVPPGGSGKVTVTVIDGQFRPIPFARSVVATLNWAPAYNTGHQAHFGAPNLGLLTMLGDTADPSGSVYGTYYASGFAGVVAIDSSAPNARANEILVLVGYSDFQPLPPDPTGGTLWSSPLGDAFHPDVSWAEGNVILAAIKFATNFKAFGLGPLSYKRFGLRYGGVICDPPSIYSDGLPGG